MHFLSIDNWYISLFWLSKQVLRWLILFKRFILFFLLDVWNAFGQEKTFKWLVLGIKMYEMISSAKSEFDWLRFLEKFIPCWFFVHHLRHKFNFSGSVKRLKAWKFQSRLSKIKLFKENSSFQQIGLVSKNMDIFQLTLTIL